MFKKVFVLVILTILFSSIVMAAPNDADLNETDLISADIPDEDEMVSASLNDDNLSATQVESKSSDGAYLVIDNDADKENINVGDYVTWIVEAQNLGLEIAKNTKIKDKLPDGLKYVRHTTTKGSFNPETGIWDIGDLSIDDGNVKLFITTLAVTVGEKINEVFITSDTLNLNNETNESEEIDVFDNPHEIHVSAKMHEAGNPIFLILLSIFVLVYTGFKNR